MRPEEKMPFAAKLMPEGHRARRSRPANHRRHSTLRGLDRADDSRHLRRHWQGIAEHRNNPVERLKNSVGPGVGGPGRASGFRITADPVWMVAVVAPAIARFHETFPGVELKLSTASFAEALRRHRCLRGPSAPRGTTRRRRPLRLSVGRLWRSRTGGDRDAHRPVFPPRGPGRAVRVYR